MSSLVQPEKYRADIDGLRAIAVIAVLLFHFDAPLVTGGYVGVDIFFVISGYLITSFLAERIDGGTFSLIDFYERRIRRIMPALFAMLLIVSLVAYLTLIPSNYVLAARSAAAAALSVSNVYFFFHSGYFDFGVQLLPLLHTWSLGVEEQFYVIFPILFWIGRRVFHLSWSTIIIVPLVASLVLCIVWTELSLSSLLHGHVKPPAALVGPFYLPFPRSWEFLVGSALAIGFVSTAVKNSYVRNGSALLGLGLILFSIVGFDSNTKFPGYAALCPCVGTALIIFANTGYTTFVGQLLRTRLLVGVGLISYSLYLWHWLLISFMRLFWGGEEPALVYCLLFLASFPIAWLSWRFIECPFRRRGANEVTRRSMFVGTSAGALAFAAVAVIAVRTQGLPSRFSPQARAIADSAKEANVLARRGCAKIPLKRDEVCTIGRSETSITFALFGDSFADALTPGVEYAADQVGRRGFVFASGGCYALLGVNTRPGCIEFQTTALRYIEETPTIDTIILISRWTSAAEGTRFGALTYKNMFISDAQSNKLSYAENKRVFVRGLERDAQAFERYHVILIAFVPEQFANVAQATSLRVQFGLNDLGTPRAVVEQRQASVKAMLQTVGAFDIIDAMSVLCDARYCQSIEGGQSLYVDDTHLSRVGAVKVGDLLAAKLR